MQSDAEVAPHDTKVHSMLDNKFPVSVPYMKELALNDDDFAAFVRTLTPLKQFDPATFELQRSGELRELVRTEGYTEAQPEAPSSRLTTLLFQHAALNKKARDLLAEGRVLTQNADLAHVNTGSHIVDCFYGLKSGANDIEKLLNNSWAVDPAVTLKMIFNARSIHLGKADRVAGYAALGWLYEFHPQTLMANLIWLARPLIQKKVEKEVDKSKEGVVGKEIKPAADVEDFEVIDSMEEIASQEESIVTPLLLSAVDAPVGANTNAHDVKYGVAHGYWKDLSNLLLFAANGELKANGGIHALLHPGLPSKENKPYKREWNSVTAKEQRKAKLSTNNKRVQELLVSDPRYRALHTTVARLFASQLRADITALKTGKGKKAISLAPKWCPSPFEAHDKHTFVVSSIAELLFPAAEYPDLDPADRNLYLKHARKSLRDQYLSPLRKHIAIVEQELSANKLGNIKYERVPTLAMEKYASTFYKKDEERFVRYLEAVSKGTSRISGAILLPSNLVEKVIPVNKRAQQPKGRAAVEKAVSDRMMDGQWASIVNRIRQSGKMESAIAVCDVSGSMAWPVFSDHTTPMHSAIGLSLLLAEVVEQPFGGAIISFSAHPSVHKVGGPTDTRSFSEKVNYIMQTDWGMNTDFVAVFEKLLLPIAVDNKLKPDEMVKRVFVFSDMQFDDADSAGERWTTSFERIKMRFDEAGYPMPELVFWNLADSTRGAPVTAATENVSLVSGYSQGMLKMFLNGGNFEDEIEEEIVDADVKDADAMDDADGVVDVEVKVKVKKDPMATVMKAVSHPSYAMLKVLD